jgi:hypothetical protein
VANEVNPALENGLLRLRQSQPHGRKQQGSHASEYAADDIGVSCTPTATTSGWSPA